MNLYKKCIAKPYSFLVIDTTLASDNPSRFRKNLLERTSKFEWRLDSIRKYHFGHILGQNVSAILDVRHCPKLQSCAISRNTNDATLRKWQKL